MLECIGLPGYGKGMEGTAEWGTIATWIQSETGSLMSFFPRS